MLYKRQMKIIINHSARGSVALY